MNSARLNMQVHFMILFFIASVIFGLGVYTFRDYNNQILLAAIVRIISSLSIFLGGFVLIKKYFFKSTVEFIKTLFMLLFPMCYVFFIIYTIKLFIHSDTLLYKFADYDFEYDENINVDDIRLLRAQSFIRLSDFESAAVEIELITDISCDLSQISVVECLHSSALNP